MSGAGFPQIALVVAIRLRRQRLGGSRTGEKTARIVTAITIARAAERYQ
jgi:hypothetical protein